MSDRSAPSTGQVRLELPAWPHFVGVARLTLAGVATCLGFDIEDIEDIKLAVAEALNLLFDDEECVAPVAVEITWDATEFDVTLDRPGALLPSDEEAQIAQVVMAEFMDVATLTGANPQVRLRKHRPGR